MKFKQLTAKDIDTLLVDIYELTDYESVNQLVKLYLMLKIQNKGKSILFTLDDLHQASYTNFHATDYHGLNDIEGYDLSKVDPAAFDDGEHLGYLSTPSEFFIRENNFYKKLNNIDFPTVCEKGLTIFEEEFPVLNV